MAFILNKDTSPKRKRESQKQPKLTPLRAMLLASMFRYKELDYDLTLLEVQKLVYFLQRLGTDFNLKFIKHIYGPYSNQLHYVLNDLDGFYLHGMKYNTAQPFDKLTLLKEKHPKIQQFIKKNCDNKQKKSLNSLYQLIDGFESPWSMELLATIDSLATEDKSLLEDLDKLSQAIALWSPRKAKIMQPHHLKVTVKRLKEWDNILYDISKNS